MFAGLTTVLGWVALCAMALQAQPAQTQPMADPPVPTRLTAALVAGGGSGRFEISGPPHAIVVLLVSPYGGGSAPSSGSRLVVQLVHPLNNLLRQGVLPADGRLTWRMKLPADHESLPDPCFFQVVALDPAPPHRILGCSAAYRLLRGPPATLEIAAPSRRWWWLFLLLPLAGAALAPVVRRRPATLLVLPAAAVVCLVLAPGPLVQPFRATLAVRGSSDRALTAHLGAELHAMVSAIRSRLPARCVVWLPAKTPIARGAPGYLESLLYPRRLVYHADDARRALAAGATLFALRPDDATPPVGYTVRDVAGPATPGFRLLRLTAADGRQP